MISTQIAGEISNCPAENTPRGCQEAGKRGFSGQGWAKALKPADGMGSLMLSYLAINGNTHTHTYIYTYTYTCIYRSHLKIWPCSDWPHVFSSCTLLLQPFFRGMDWGTAAQAFRVWFHTCLGQKSDLQTWWFSYTKHDPTLRGFGSRLEPISHLESLSPENSHAIPQRWGAGRRKSRVPMEGELTTFQGPLPWKNARRALQGAMCTLVGSSFGCRGCRISAHIGAWELRWPSSDMWRNYRRVCWKKAQQVNISGGKIHFFLHFSELFLEGQLAELAHFRSFFPLETQEHWQIPWR